MGVAWHVRYVAFVILESKESYSRVGTAQNDPVPELKGRKKMTTWEVKTPKNPCGFKHNPQSLQSTVNQSSRQSLSTMLAKLSDEEKHSYRVGLYDRYFAAVPAGGDAEQVQRSDQDVPQLELGILMGPRKAVIIRYTYINQQEWRDGYESE